MNVHTDTLNQLAHHAHVVNGHLLRAVASGDTPTCHGHVWDAQRANNLLMQRLRLLGADTPGHAEQSLDSPVGHAEAADLRAVLSPAGNEGLPLHLLASPAARRYAQALRDVARACKEMEAERGIEDGLTEMFEVYAESAEIEVFGPVGTKGLE